MSVNTNQTNANSAEIFPALGGGGTSNITGQTISPNTVEFFNYPRWGLTWDGNSRDINIVKVAWEVNSEILTVDNGTLPDKLGMSTCVLGWYGEAPYGEVSGMHDGVTIGGKDGGGVPTQTWLEAHDGIMKLNCVSSMTDSAKTATLDWNGFMSTMASVYPAIIKPYS